MNEIVTYSAAENQLYQDVKTIIEEARANAIRSVDYNRVLMYWKTGRRVFEEEQHGKERADYGSYLIERLARRLEPGYGSGFSKRQIHLSVQFFRTYPKVNALRSQLNWTQYRTLIQISEVLWRSCDFVRGNFSNNPGWEALFGEVRGHKVTTSPTRMATRPRNRPKSWMNRGKRAATE